MWDIYGLVSMWGGIYSEGTGAFWDMFIHTIPNKSIDSVLLSRQIASFCSFRLVYPGFPTNRLILYE